MATPPGSSSVLTSRSSPGGVVQAERVARRAPRGGSARIVSSKVARAVTTAEHLRRATGAPPSCEPLLRERNSASDVQCTGN